MSKRYTPPKKSSKTTIDISQLEAEKRDLYRKGNNPKRLEEVIKRLDYLFYGIK